METRSVWAAFCRIASRRSKASRCGVAERFWFRGFLKVSLGFCRDFLRFSWGFLKVLVFKGFLGFSWAFLKVFLRFFQVSPRVFWFCFSSGDFLKPWALLLGTFWEIFAIIFVWILGGKSKKGPGTPFFAFASAFARFLLRSFVGGGLGWSVFGGVLVVFGGISSVFCVTLRLFVFFFLAPSTGPSLSCSSEDL